MNKMNSPGPVHFKRPSPIAGAICCQLQNNSPMTSLMRCQIIWQRTSWYGYDHTAPSAAVTLTIPGGFEDQSFIAPCVVAFWRFWFGLFR